MQSILLQSAVGNSYDFLAESLALAPVLETSQLQIAWTILSLTSATYAPKVSLVDPINGTLIPLTTAVVLIGPHGRWHDAIKRFTWDTGYFLNLPVEQADTGGEKAGAISMLRRKRIESRTPETDALLDMLAEEKRRKGEVEEAAQVESAKEKIAEYQASIEQLAKFDTSNLVALESPKLPRTSIYHVPSELMAFLNPSRAELYHHLYSGLQHEVLASSQKQAAYFLNGVSLSLFATGTQETVQYLFPPSEVYLKHMARFNFVFSNEKSKWEWTRYQRRDPSEAINAIRTRLSRPAVSETEGYLALNDEAFAYLLNYRAISSTRLSRQFDAYQSIRPNHLLRIAGLVALLRDPTDTVVNQNDIRLADFLLFGAEERLQALYFTAYMGINGRVLATLLDGIAQFKQIGRPMTHLHAVAWCVTSGINAKHAEQAIEQLTASKIIVDSSFEQGIRTIFDDQERSFTMMLRRIGIIAKFSAFKD